MEHPGLYRNKLFVLMMMLCSACTMQSKQVFVNADTVSISTERGITKINEHPFSGNLFQLYPNGDTLFVRSYKNGKEEGVWKEFYPSHSIKEIRFFNDGRKQSRYIAFWENGAKKLEYNFENGEYEGACREWLPNGMLLKEMNYKNGYEEGAQKAWYDDGRIRSNYTIVNGRRFGLLGTKNCRNVSDSIFNQ